ncbi:hypothetical protein HPB47_017525 [Ixodes persulcatus]|uniref:Uncharacterized protein n=1 Tax=Ixodes persulcatus TaxID=34615 RepID=A0AC60QN27_IXOPE|nr:hypothetical protein HPB47_017525 [Ixodes persulcatus]
MQVVLLYGPPGLGKTTLAHVIARHAGYNVVELNASDDRSPEVFKTTLEAATQMRAVLGQDPRPNCLIIDEIDGAPAFVQSRKQQLTLTDVRTFNVGQKDIQRGLFSVLQEVFQKPRNDRKAYRQLYGDEDPTLSRLRSPEDLRFENLVHSTQAFGDYEKFVQALFDNYIQQGPEWLCFVDGLLNTVHRLQNYSLYPYLPYVAPAFHCAFSVLPYTKMVFQNSFLEARGKETQLSNILSSLRADTSPQSRCYLTGTTLVLDVLPWLTGILQPTIRPVNTQLFSAEERQKLQQVISVMASFNLTYHQARTADGVYQYALEPSIDEVTRFPGVAQPPQLTYATKQLIAREVVLDFFGRVIQKPIQGANAGSSSGADKGSGGLGSGQIYYQFKEGFSNAVRRTVRMKDLL